jgi:hypothetical protein
MAVVAFVVIAVVVALVITLLLNRNTGGRDAIDTAMLPPTPVGPGPIQQLHDQGLIRDPNLLALKKMLADDDAIQAQRSGGAVPNVSPPVTSLTPTVVATQTAGTNASSASVPSGAPSAAGVSTSTAPGLDLSAALAAKLAQTK